MLPNKVLLLNENLDVSRIFYYYRIRHMSLNAGRMYPFFERLLAIPIVSLS